MPHPDDEAVFLSGTIRQLVKNKVNVKIVTVTRGEASTLHFGLKDSDDLATAREKELRNVFKILGVREYEILRFNDGGLSNQLRELKSRIQNEIDAFQPSMIMTLEPDGIYGHPDHISLTKAVVSSVKSPVRLVFATIAEYKVKPKASHMARKEVNPLKPNLIIKLGFSDKIAKIRALKAHKSQFNFQKTKPDKYNFFKTNKLLDFEYLVV